MRHRVAGRKFSLPSDQRRALLKGLVRALIEHDRIVTTETRAKDVRPIAEKLITIAKRNDIHARRLVRQYLDSNVAEFGVNAETGKLARNPHYIVPRLFEVVAPRYRDRPGGYCRITKLGARRGDGAPMVLLELVDSEEIAPAAPVEQQVVSRR
ncbi:MAG TPA: 50S ribosomal protein L17, partial [Chthonomonadales bacterium]|nr:50S ribosomal protein L17 [Chthonomonadales bacterium]